MLQKLLSCRFSSLTSCSADAGVQSVRPPSVLGEFSEALRCWLLLTLKLSTNHNSVARCGVVECIIGGCVVLVHMVCLAAPEARVQTGEVLGVTGGRCLPICLSKNGDINLTFYVTPFIIFRWDARPV